jgi:hypothetical protein
MSDLFGKLVGRYEKLVQSGAGQVGQVEMGARALLQLLPGRFADAELATECGALLLDFAQRDPVNSCLYQLILH